MKNVAISTGELVEAGQNEESGYTFIVDRLSIEEAAATYLIII